MREGSLGNLCLTLQEAVVLFPKVIVPCVFPLRMYNCDSRPAHWPPPRNPCLLWFTRKPCLLGFTRNPCLLGFTRNPCLLGFTRKPCLLGFTRNPCLLGFTPVCGHLPCCIRVGLSAELSSNEGPYFWAQVMKCTCILIGWKPGLQAGLCRHPRDEGLRAVANPQLETDTSC